MSKVRVIGLDGGTFAVIDYLVGQGRMPNFARLMECGSRATLLSTVPPVTWPAWASFYTGKNPGKTGAADLFRFRPGTYQLEPMNAGNIEGQPLWSLASSRGKRVCVYNVPVTYPAVPVNGIMISGLDAPAFNEQAVYPPDFKSRFTESVPDFKINFVNEAKYLVNNFKDPVQEWIRRAQAYLDMEMRSINFLMRLEDWDLFVAVIRSTDVFQHTLWRDAEAVMRGETVTAEGNLRAEAMFGCYETIDRHFQEGGWSDDGDLIVMSDHGFGEVYGHVSVNRVLADAGLLKFRQQAKQKRSRSFVKDSVQRHMSINTKNKVKAFLRMDKPGGQWSSYVDVLIADIDWEQTRICSIGGFGSLFVNAAGRFPGGIVASENERQEVMAAAEAALSDLNDPRDGLPMASGFYRREELYHGPLLTQIPDMVVDLRNWSYCPVIGTANDLAFEEIVRPPVQEWKQLALTGTHRREGILIMHGRNIKRADLGTAEMVDVAPTVMRLLGLPPLDDWDSEPLSGAFVGDEFREEVKAGDYQVAESKAGDAYSEEDEEEVRKHLQDLGYL